MGCSTDLSGVKSQSSQVSLEEGLRSRPIADWNWGQKIWWGMTHLALRLCMAPSRSLHPQNARRRSCVHYGNLQGSVICVIPPKGPTNLHTPGAISSELCVTFAVQSFELQIVPPRPPIPTTPLHTSTRHRTSIIRLQDDARNVRPITGRPATTVVLRRQ